jgi:hypothetical protein
MPALDRADRVSSVATAAAKTAPGRLFQKRPRLLRVLGPGLITGASDDDPSGIGTYSQAGAQFGFAMMDYAPQLSIDVAIQQISARVGRITGKDIAGNRRQHIPIGCDGTLNNAGRSRPVAALRNRFSGTAFQEEMPASQKDRSHGTFQ